MASASAASRLASSRPRPPRAGGRTPNVPAAAAIRSRRRSARTAARRGRAGRRAGSTGSSSGPAPACIAARISSIRNALPRSARRAARASAARAGCPGSPPAGGSTSSRVKRGSSIRRTERTRSQAAISGRSGCDPVNLVGAEGEHEQHAHAAKLADEQRHEVERGAIRPMQVLDHEHQWPVGGQALDHPEHQLEQLGRCPPRRPGAARRRAARIELGEQPG